jgi:hypothetical protein
MARPGAKLERLSASRGDAVLREPCYLPPMFRSTRWPEDWPMGTDFHCDQHLILRPRPQIGCRSSRTAY